MSTNPNKGGRPALGIKAKKNYVTVSFSDFDFEKLQQKAQACGLKPSVLVAQLANNGKVIPRFTEEVNQQIKTLSIFNNNLNQIAKNLNYFAQHYRQNDVLKQVNRIDLLLDQIDEILK